MPRQELAQTPARQGLICVGTSATVGDEGKGAELRQYAADVFGRAFDERAILREERQRIDELLGTAIIQTHITPQPNLAERVDPARYGDAESYLQAQHELFFGTPIEGDFHAVDWRIALAEKLRGHLMFVNLLRTLADGPLPLPAVAARMRTSLPLSTDGVQAEREAVGLLNGLCALISAAREDDGAGGAKPFLSVGLHLWVRELRRMVCRVASTGTEAAPTMLRHSDDLNPEDSALHLPLVQCRECRVTGWGAVQRAASSQVGRDLREFYNRFFSRDMDVRFYFPAEGEQPPGVAGRNVALCGHCGHIHAGHGAANATCTSCGEGKPVPAFCPETLTASANRTILSRDCPICNASEALIIARGWRDAPQSRLRAARRLGTLLRPRSSDGDSLVARRSASAQEESTVTPHSRMFKATLPLLLIAVSVAGCVTPTPTPPTPIRVQGFDAAEAAYIHDVGTNRIEGNAFLRQKGGGVVTCAGEAVRLIPLGRFAKKYFRIRYIEKKAATLDPWTPGPFTIM